MIVCEIISEYGGPHCSSTTSLLPKTGCSVVSLQEKGWDKSPSLSIVFGVSSKTQWLSGLYYANFINFYSPTQLCGGGTTKSNSNELPISVPLSSINSFFSWPSWSRIHRNDKFLLLEGSSLQNRQLLVSDPLHNPR